MQLLDQEQAIRQQIFDYFGYQEDWRVLPFSDSRDMLWKLYQDEDGYGSVIFAETDEELNTGEGNCYSNVIYTNRHLPKWVYLGAEFTMIVVDTRTDGNQFLQIFSNDKERSL